MSTHTFVTLEISPEAYDEIARKLSIAGYDHVFHDDGRIDMHGIAVKSEEIIVERRVTSKDGHVQIKGPT